MSRMKVIVENNSLNPRFVSQTRKMATGGDLVPAGKDMKKLLDKDR
jgi:hypothetical protein